MVKTVRRLNIAGLAAALMVSPAADQYYPPGAAGMPCGCRIHPSSPRSYSYQRARIDEGYRQQVFPSVVGARTTSRVQPQLHYNSEEAQALYHPVVVPLEEFLRPGQPIALTPEQLARQRTAAEGRAAPSQPPQVDLPPAGTSVVDPDPFADDAAEEAPAGDAASAAGAPTDEDAFAEEMTAEQPEAEATPAAEAAPESEPADSGDDPFNIP